MTADRTRDDESSHGTSRRDDEPSDGVAPNLDDDGQSESGAEDDGTENEQRQPPRYAPPPQENFDWRGWILVGVVVVSFLVIPGAILYLQQAQAVVSSLGLSLRQAYLTLPMIPAILLGATAIWAAVRSRSERN
jgi:hypothetical protein